MEPRLSHAHRTPAAAHTCTEYVCNNIIHEVVVLISEYGYIPIPQLHLRDYNLSWYMLLMYLITYASIVSCSSVTFNTSGTVQWVFYAILSVMSFTLINKEFSHSLHVY